MSRLLPLNRRKALQFGGVVLAGWATGKLLQRAAPIERAIADPDLARMILDDDGSTATGPENASLRLAVFTDYRCPACRRSAPEMEQAVHADGDVRVIYKDWPIFGAPSTRAATIALASARQGIYPAVHRILMSAPRFDESVLRGAVVRVGGSWSRLCEDVTTYADEIASRLSENAGQARSLGLPGTPGFLAEQIVVLGAIDAHDFRRLFERARDGT